MKTLLFIVSMLISMTAIFLVINNDAYNRGYEKGATDGIVATLDTIDKITTDQINKDTCVRLTLIASDTTTFILSKTTVIIK